MRQLRSTRSRYLEPGRSVAHRWITLAKAAANPQLAFQARVERVVALAETEAPEDHDRICLLTRAS
jgi:hypothetical protein